MERKGIGPLVLGGIALFVLGAMMFGGAATAGAGAGAAAAGAWALWPFFFLFKLVFFFLLFGFIARAFWRGGGPWGRRGPRSGVPGWRGPGAWGPWARGEDEEDEEAAHGHGDRPPASRPQDRFEDWHLKAHARMDIDREVPDPTRDDDLDEV